MLMLQLDPLGNIPETRGERGEGAAKPQGVLVGNTLQVLVDEGDSPLSDGMKLLFRVVRYAPDQGPGQRVGVVGELLEPVPPGLKECHVFVHPRYVGHVIDDALGETGLTVNVLVYERNERLLGTGIGHLIP